MQAISGRDVSVVGVIVPLEIHAFNRRVNNNEYTSFESMKRENNYSKVFLIVKGTSALSLDISRDKRTHIQGIRATDSVVYLNTLLTLQMSAPNS
ncbi:hypothetical protein [Desulfoluna sp.]|uniref:hypothetical protein n=1 Tax=Desulfoluna sp. TaxID=2045199 RepID=UPI0026170BCE|nr:hypothetical protein [Desulfoluna sp.]